VLDPSGKVVLSWGKKGDQPGQFKYPSGIAVDEQGSVYVVDGGNGRIQVFDGKGVFLRSFGTRGSGRSSSAIPAASASSGGSSMRLMRATAAYRS